MYTNGSLAGTRPSVLPAPNAFPFNIGGGGIFDALAVNGNYFNGQIDEVALFDRALSAEQVRSLYMLGSGAAVILIIERTPTGVLLTWPTGTLQSTDVIESAPLDTIWTDVPGATSPFPVPIGTATTNQFYRVRL